MAAAAGVNDIQSVYFIHDVRNGILKRDIVQNCLMCSRCNEACPVGIDNYALRSVKREAFNKEHQSSFEYIPDQHPMEASVAYFAGCMGQLTPSVTRSMEQIMQTAGEQYIYLDKKESICCGRPLMLMGRETEGRILMKRNRDLIIASGARLLVTSCPICYKMFREEYELDIQVMHHSEYLKDLLDKNLLKLKKSDLRLVYHDPCELGRGSGIYEQPRKVINSIASLIEPENSRKKAICCGGSLGNTVLGISERRKITQFALENLITGNPDQIITACPLCKKTFSNEAGHPVFDLAEIVAKSLIKERKKSLNLATELSLAQ
jgi:Fe-S oxidoreductase